jgi:hypothetical protein
MSVPFVPEDFEVPQTLDGPRFHLEPLGPVHNERDHEAWMSSIDHIRSTPGFPDGSWPRLMSLAENLRDLERHAGDFARREGFTYSVLEDEEVIGCVYIYPDKAGGTDAEVQSWVRLSRAEMDVPVWRAVSTWLEEEWPFRSFDYAGRVDAPRAEM